MDIGIDLGTTFSVLAVNGKVALAADYPPGLYLGECDVTVIPTPYGEPTFASVMMFDPDDLGRPLFAADAVLRAEEGHALVAFSKRKIGTQELIPTAARPVSAREVARGFLHHLKECAERALGRPVRRAVVTHPAYFDRNQVEETRLAAIDAGFDMGLPVQMLMEPLAAAYTYVRTDPRDPLRVLTYDLGGGTFDVTYLERNEGVIAMRSFDGDPLLGGYNFDRALVHWLRERVAARGRTVVFDEDDPADRGRLSRLLRIAEGVKIALAKAPDDATPVDFRVRNVIVDDKGKDVAVNERISRAEFVGLIRPLLDRTVAACHRALGKAKVEAEDVDEVLLVGGSTRGPWVAECVRAAFPRLTPKLFEPDLCVGAGAAIAARLTLPPLVETGACRLVLDAPEQSAVPRVSVAGRVTGTDGPLRATLDLPTGESLGPTELRPDGGFLFDNIDLSEDGPSRFSLTVATADGTVVIAHPFEVAYSPQTTETTAVTTVLPKSLSIETLDGLTLLAAEGAPLPARCEQTFRRLNDNPSIPLRLFQGTEPVGEVRILNIPKEGGRGSFVDLRLELTEKNQIKGTAQVRTPNGNVVARADVSIHFDTPEVPPAGILIDQYDELRNHLMYILRADP
ncbi:MAG TPA: Hsp70 family protein, partial [Urbifossiella sp.]|nr:Hsp70 family protein [Urbifossiella sp.]